MKKMMMTTVMAVALTMTAFAQESDKREGKEQCEFPCEQMVKDLNLSDEQVAKLKAADEAFVQEAKAVHEKEQKTKSDGREAMKAAKSRRDAALKATLTQEQYIKYLEDKVERLERGGRGMKDFHRKGDGRMDKPHRVHRADSMGVPPVPPRRFEKR